MYSSGTSKILDYSVQNLSNCITINNSKSSHDAIAGDSGNGLQWDLFLEHLHRDE
jgi:hypothetical protein